MTEEIRKVDILSYLDELLGCRTYILADNKGIGFNSVSVRDDGTHPINIILYPAAE